MKLTQIDRWPAATWIGTCALALASLAGAQSVSLTTVQGTVFLANGQPGAGTLEVSWPAFTTANNLAVTAGRTTVTIPSNGSLSVNLAPNLGATPAGLYYTAVYNLSDGTTSTEYWVVPATSPATLGSVRAQLMPAAQAVQAVNKAYVDESIAALAGSLLTASGGTLSGPLYLSGDPTQPLQAADKHYVDSTFSAEVPTTGGTMTGPLWTPAVNAVESPVAGTVQTTLQAAMSAAGTTGALEIPPTYTGTDAFTNPHGVRVMDLRTAGAQQLERSVKEFGAVCDGVTDDTTALQAALNYAQAHGVALTIPQGTCKTQSLNWHGESIGGLGKQVSALLGFPGQDVLATMTDSLSLLSYTRLHDLAIYVDQSADISCSPARGRAAAGSCAVGRLLESNSIFSPGGNGLTGVAGAGTAWAVGNCAIAMPAATGAGGNGLRVAEFENLEIAATGADPLAQYPGAHSTHTCGLYLAQWPQWSEFRNIDIRGVNTGIAIPALPVTTPAGLAADSNRWQNITIQAAHAFTAAAGSNNVLDNVVALAGNSAATAEPPTGLVLDFAGAQQGWTVRNAVVLPTWNAVPPKLTVTAAGGAVTAVAVGAEHGLGFDPYGTQIPVTFSGSCTAAASASVNTDGSIGTVTITTGGVGCSGTTAASLGAPGTWDTAAPVNLIAGQSMTFFGGNLLKGNGGYTVWNAAGSQTYGTQMDSGGGTLPGGGTYPALVANSRPGSAFQVDQFPGADFGAKLQACLLALPASYGGACDARNFTGTLSMGSNLAISTANATVLLPCATIATPNQAIVTAGTRNTALRGCALRGASNAGGSLGGTVFLYSGAGPMIQVGDPTYAVDTSGFHLDNVVINTTASSSAAAQGLAAYRTQEMDLESLYFLGNSNQTGITLDGTGNYTGGTFFDNQFDGFQIAVNAIGHQVTNPATTDWMNASTFVRLHIDCPESAGSPIAGTYGINLLQGDGNTFTGGDVEGCSTALHLGPNAQNNTIVGLRNEVSTNQVVADAGSAYNSWMTGGTMFTGALTDNGTRNSFLDTFHRSFNGLNGDWYGSQKDATVTNHYRLGIGAGNERGLLDRYQTDYGYRWTMGLSDATAGEQFYQILDELNSVYRLSIGQYNNGASSTNNQTVINAAGTGAIVLNGSTNGGTGGVVFGSGGPSETTVATIDNAGDAQFNGNLAVSGISTFTGYTMVKNQADAEIDAFLWAGATTSQKESVIYKDWNGNSQWYMVKDASNNWALNSAIGGLDSFKAYQSVNSGDTYIDASNSTGVVRINYETGSGSAFNIYGGSSSSLYASFTGTASIKFPGLAAASGHNCLQIDNSGYITNTGAACGTGSGGSGTVNSGTTGQIAYYASGGAAVSGTNAVPVAAGGTGASTAAGALANIGGISSTLTSSQALASPIIVPSVNNLTNFASLPGSTIAAQFNNWIAATNTAATRSFLWVDPQVASGNPTSALGSLTRIADARGANCMDSSGGYTFADNALCIEAAEDSADSTTSTTSKADLHLSYNSLAGGVYNFNGSTGVKSNRSILALNGEYSTAAQKWGIASNLSSYVGGETIPFSAEVTEYGGYLSNGQESDEGVRIQQQQGSASDGAGGVWSAAATAVNTGAGVVTFSTPTANAATLGESRFIRDLHSKYNAGTYTAVSCSGSGPTTCTITGSGTAWTTIAGFVGTHTAYNNLSSGGNILTNNLVFCAAPGANGGFDACVPITAGAGDTSLTVNLYAVGTQSNTSWPWAGSGSYAIYGSAYPTAVNTSADTFTAGDVSGIGSGDTLDQVLAYNSSFLGLQLIQSHAMGLPSGGGINLENLSNSTAPAFSGGIGVSGNYLCAICIQSSNASSGSPGIDLQFSARPAGGEANIVDSSTAATASYNFYQTRMSDDSTATVFAINPNMASSSVGLGIFGTALTVGANNNGVAVNGVPNPAAQFYVNVASGASYGMVDTEATAPLCSGCSMFDIDGHPTAGQTNYKRFADNGYGVLSEQNNNGAVTTWYSNGGVTQTAQVNGATGAAAFASLTDSGLASATVLGTSSTGLLQAASTSGSGALALVGGPTFTGNATTFANSAASEDDVVIQPGSTADQIGAVEWNSYAGMDQWKLRKDASNYLRLTDMVNSLDRAVFYQNGQTILNAGAGANPAVLNGSANSGTGGLLVESGGSSPAAVLTVTGSGNTTATGFMSGKFMIGSGTMSLTAGAAAGSSPTIACASSHVCDGVSGTVTLTTGTSTTTGTLATLGFPNTHTNQANCVVAPTLSGTGLVTTIGWSESTTALTLTANTALTASTAYQLRYWCGGN
jgi:hypothetical protein